MKIGLLGGSGQVGYEIRALAEDQGVAIDAPDSGQVDIRNRERLQAWISGCGCTHFINCAAFTAVDAAEAQRPEAFAINDLGARHLAELAATFRPSAPVLYLSTDYVFPGDHRGGLNERAAPDPQSVYGASKLAGEQATLNHPLGLVLRISWVFGRHGHNFVKSILRAAQAKRPLRVVDDQLGAPCSAASVARAALALVQLNPESERLFHFGAQPATDWCSFSREIVAQATAMGLLERCPEVEAIASSELQQPAPRPANSLLDPSRLCARLEIDIPDWRTELTAVLAAFVEEPERLNP